MRPFGTVNLFEGKLYIQTGKVKAVSKEMAANPKVVEDYRGGKTNALGFLVGQCMRASKGNGNPNIMREMLEKALNG